MIKQKHSGGYLILKGEGVVDNVYAYYPDKVKELMDLLKAIQKAPKGKIFK